MSRIIFSASNDYLSVAGIELRSLVPGGEVERLGPETGLLEAVGTGIANIAEACRRRPVVFVRHLMRERARVPLGEADEVTVVVRRA